MDEQQLVQDESHLNVNYATYQQTQSNAYQVNTAESMMANQSYYSRQSQYQPPMNSYNQVYSANQQVSPSTNYQQPMMNAANTTMMNNYSTNISINNTTNSLGMMGEDVKGGGLLHQLLLDWIVWMNKNSFFFSFLIVWYVFGWEDWRLKNFLCSHLK